jgi:tRNA threonylcarbamoyladenosine biosynthesis protein TsaE
MSVGNVLTLPSGSPQETLSIGESIGRRLPGGAVVLLIGPLGAGKTTLAKGIARGLGIEEEIISPTYTIVCEYPGAKPLHHIDLYRVEGCEQVESLGLDDILWADGVSLVEWGEKLPQDFIRKPVRVGISMGGGDERIITVQGLPS